MDEPADVRAPREPSDGASQSCLRPDAAAATGQQRRELLRRLVLAIALDPPKQLAVRRPTGGKR